MRKLLSIVLVIALTLCFAPVTQAENKENKGEAPAAPGEARADGEYDAVVLPAIDALLERWRDVYTDPYRADMYVDHAGYLEIIHTRVFSIQEDPRSNGSDRADERAAELFGNVDYVVEFELLSDYLGTEPFPLNVQMYDVVLVDRNGNPTVSMYDPFISYYQTTYQIDLSGIVREVVDLSDAYNAEYHLLTE